MTNAVPSDLAQRLAAILPAAALREIAPHYLEEPRGKWHGQAAAVVAPANAEEVAATLRLASDLGVGVIPYGGGTGLVSGQVAPEGPAPLILSLERMAAIRAVYPEEAVLIAEAGATVAQIQTAAREAGLLFPLSYAADGSARIGGALSVNSGGINVLRYGTARDLCLGIEAVLPSGEILHGLRRLRKDNTGYSLRNLLIGAEGTLGVITAASLRLSPIPAHTGTALLAVASPAAALSLLARTRERVLDGLSAFEIIAGVGFEFLEETGFGLRPPLDAIPEWSVLMELGTGPGTDPDAVLADVFESALEDGLAHDGVIAASGPQRDSLWALRETLPLANFRVGAVASHDISVPLAEIPGFIDAMANELTALAPFRINAFGHLGDGNLHYNIFPPLGEKAATYRHLSRDVTRRIYDRLATIGGSISAEHGIGRFRTGDLETYGDPAALTAMHAIKAALDPKGIMNPGAVLNPRPSP